MDFRFREWTIRAADRSAEVEQIAELAADLESAEAAGKLELMKTPSEMRRVVAGKLPSGLDVVIKFYIPYGKWHAIKDMFRSGYSKSAYRAGLELIERGVATPRPIACGWKMDGLRLERSFIATERIMDAPDLGAKAKKVLASGDESKQKGFIKSLADKLYDMHRKGFYHPDLKDFHIFVRETGDDFELVYIDLDRCKILSNISAPMRHRNLYQIRYYVLNEWPEELRTLFLDEYCMLWKGDPEKSRAEVKKALEAEFARLHKRELTLIKQEKRALTLQGRLLEKNPMPEGIEERIEKRRERKIERRSELAKWKSGADKSGE